MRIDAVQISNFVAPVVLISACGLLCLAFYNRLAAVVTRLRTFMREQTDIIKRITYLQETNGTTGENFVLNNRSRILERQIITVLRRAQLLRLTLIFLLLAIMSFIITSVIYGFSYLSPHLILIGVIFLCIGLALVGISLTFALIEMFLALRPVQLEFKQLQDLKNKNRMDDSGE